MSNKYYLKKLNDESLKEVFNYEIQDFDLYKFLNKEILKELGLDYCIIYNFDGVITDYTSNVDLDIDNIIEARFFNDKKEIRIFNYEGNITGTIFREGEDSNKIEREYLLYPRYKEIERKEKYASKLKVKEYIDYDEDNQAYIDYVKPSKLVFAGGDN